MAVDLIKLAAKIEIKIKPTIIVIAKFDLKQMDQLSIESHPKNYHFKLFLEIFQSHAAIIPNKSVMECANLGTNGC